MVPVRRDVIGAQVDAMMAVLRETHPDAPEKLIADPIVELSNWPDLAVRLVPESDTGSLADQPPCSVAGVYLGDETPPVLAVATSMSPGRRAFTALHELGHHVQRTEPKLWDLLFAQPDRGLALEDAACDGFAAEILLPAALVNQFIEARGPTAQHIVDLWRASTASRAAVCVRAAQRLVTPGHVVLLDASGTVSFAASAGLPPVARGSQQGAIDTVREAYDRGGRATGRTRLRYRDGILGEPMHAQIVPMNGFLVMVAVVDSAPWETFSLSSRAPGPLAASWTCEQPECGHEFRSFEQPCARCGCPICPECARCGCAPRVKERVCSGCFQRLPSVVFTGTSTRCLDCT
jgi:Zn-dependent peptidase ImmA (M78 family)